MAKKVTNVADKGPGETDLTKAKGGYSLTLYFYAVVGGRRFPAQQTLACDSADDFTNMLPEFYASLEPEEGDFVTFEPRDIGPVARAPAKSSSGGRGGGGGGAQQERVLGPECPFHNTPTTQKQGRNGPFFSCSKKRDDGSWCNWTPEQEG